MQFLVCGGLGLFTGTMVAYFKVPPFVSSLGMMMVSSGFAYMLSGGLSIYQLPDAFSWLGRGDDLGGIPNAVVLMIILYLLAHFLMKGTTIGRYIYAVGGNSEAARLSGIPVKRILLWVYAGSASLAGLGGVVMASQFQSGDPKYGLMYELYVIAAVVVGGTSLAGGRGRVFGTFNRSFYNCSYTKWNESYWCAELYPKGCFGIRVISCCFDRPTKKTWMANQWLMIHFRKDSAIV